MTESASQSSHNVCNVQKPLCFVASTARGRYEEHPAIKELRSMLQQLSMAEAMHSDKLWRTVCHIRDSKIPPKALRKVMKEQGWQAARISEMMQVAYCSEKVFRDYRKRCIGWRIALAKARTEKHGPERAGRLLERRFEAAFFKLADNGIKESLRFLGKDALCFAVPVRSVPTTGLRRNYKVGPYKVQITVIKDEKSRVPNESSGGGTPPDGGISQQPS